MFFIFILYHGQMNLQVFETVFAFTIVVLLCLLLRKLSIIKTGDNMVFTKLLTQVVPPAVIFLQLSALVMAHIVLSIVMVPAVFYLIG